MQRRMFAAGLTAAAAAPVLLSATPAAAHDRDHGHGPDHDQEGQLLRAMLASLTAELDDRSAARALTPHLYDVGFAWEPPVAPLQSLDFVLAYGFGNRPPAGGGDPTKVLFEPGPVNEELADTVARIRRARPGIPVYAQWEIARFLESKYRMRNVTSIEPVIAPDGTITYLSTDGVAAQVAAARAHLPGGVGRAAVVGFRDHVKRCVQTTVDRGITAFAPRGFAMPETYDAKSGQAWTRRRDLYLVHDMVAQWSVLRQKLITQAYPQG
ncbi:hypothetical protein [Streptomyces sp. NPDC090025]|uniref:hypothetical protein n=1 Tax=Streptomyces sp. NPDC090025 TaxID=3365922 RepID=UPI003833BD24